MSDIDDFLAAPDAPDPCGREFTYADEDNAIRSAKAYAADSLNTGAHDLRKLVKTVEMMRDPDMGDHLGRALKNFCELMFDICLLVRGITEADDAINGLRLIEAVKVTLGRARVICVCDPGWCAVGVVCRGRTLGRWSGPPPLQTAASSS
jgi:hypothetical protein